MAGATDIVVQRFVRLIGIGAVCATCGGNAAADSLALTAGIGITDSPDRMFFSYQRDWERRWLERAGWHVSGAWDVGVGVWRGKSASSASEGAMELSATPVFRVQRDSRDGVYLEAGVGMYLLSATQIGDRDLGSPYQFGSRVGVGLRFGGEQTFDLSYHVQHVSNASLKAPNDGAEFHVIRAQYHF